MSDFMEDFCHPFYIFFRGVRGRLDFKGGSLFALCGDVTYSLVLNEKKKKATMPKRFPAAPPPIV